MQQSAHVQPVQQTQANSDLSPTVLELIQDLQRDLNALIDVAKKQSPEEGDYEVIRGLQGEMWDQKRYPNDRIKAYKAFLSLILGFANFEASRSYEKEDVVITEVPGRLFGTNKVATKVKNTVTEHYTPRICEKLKGFYQRHEAELKTLIAKAEQEEKEQKQRAESTAATSAAEQKRLRKEEKARREAAEKEAQEAKQKAVELENKAKLDAANRAAEEARLAADQKVKDLQAQQEKERLEREASAAKEEANYARENLAAVAFQASQQGAAMAISYAVAFLSDQGYLGTAIEQYGDSSKLQLALVNGFQTQAAQQAEAQPLTYETLYGNRYPIIEAFSEFYRSTQSQTEKAMAAYVICALSNDLHTMTATNILSAAAEFFIGQKIIPAQFPDFMGKAKEALEMAKQEGPLSGKPLSHEELKFLVTHYQDEADTFLPAEDDAATQIFGHRYKASSAQRKGEQYDIPADAVADMTGYRAAFEEKLRRLLVSSPKLAMRAQAPAAAEAQTPVAVAPKGSSTGNTPSPN